MLRGMMTMESQRVVMLGSAPLHLPGGDSRTGESLRPAVPGWLPAWTPKLTIELSDRSNANRRKGPRGSSVLFPSWFGCGC
jgi:hypothetical protein